MILVPGEPEHNAFESAMVLGLEELRRQGGDEGFERTLEQHQKLFDRDKPYSMLVDDFRYIIDLATMGIGRANLSRH